MVRKEFEVPDGYELLYGIALGYPSKDHVNSFKAQRFEPADIKVAPKG
jgi:hypothetical protein